MGSLGAIRDGVVSRAWPTRSAGTPAPPRLSSLTIAKPACWMCWTHLGDAVALVVGLQVDRGQPGYPGRPAVAYRKARHRLDLISAVIACRVL